MGTKNYLKLALSLTLDQSFDHRRYVNKSVLKTRFACLLYNNSDLIYRCSKYCPNPRVFYIDRACQLNKNEDTSAVSRLQHWRHPCVLRLQRPLQNFDGTICFEFIYSFSDGRRKNEVNVGLKIGWHQDRPVNCNSFWRCCAINLATNKKETCASDDYDAFMKYEED